MKLVTALMLLGLAKADHDPRVSCQQNIECEQQIGKGACCLYISTPSFFQQSCKDAAFTNYYTKSPYYNPDTMIWTNPQDTSVQTEVYCVEELMPITPKNMMLYPYNQTFMDSYFVNMRDPIHKNVQSNQFFYPKSILTEEDQEDKLLTLLFYGLTWPFLCWIYFFNDQSNGWAFWLGVLGNIFSGEPDAWAHYPQMYLNFIPQIYLAEQSYDAGVLGPYKFYDMFSLNGFWQFHWDLFIQWIPLLQLGLAWGRGASGDYRAAQTLPIFDSVDHNRLNLASGGNPWDYAYWSTQMFGVDCNGNMGEGLYCFCESQGYNCGCQPVEWFENTPRLECFDHIGYTCQGVMVDGEELWCQHPLNTFYQFDDLLDDLVDMSEMGVMEGQEAIAAMG